MAESRSILERLFSLEGKTALVTGASGGIGRALSVALAEAGAVVGLHGTNEERLEETRRCVEEAGGQSVVLTADLRFLESCRQLIAEAHAALGRLDILINNAGMNRRKPLVEFTEDDYETIMAVNLRSVFYLSQAAYPLMAAQGGGKIIHIGSMTTYLGFATVGIYGMTKSAVAQLTKTMAVEWAKDNIQVNCLCPGFIKTPLTASAQWANPHRARWILERVPARRPGYPEDLVGMTLLLASPASDFVTGQVIAVDGGFLAGGSWVEDNPVPDPLQFSG
jgi:NAD(P)-dependent dehydrogenase (short-subunit alcohol dehydrogenase family)